MTDGTPLVECNPTRPSGESSHEDCLPFPLDDEPSGQDGSPSQAMKKSSVRTTYGFSVDIRSNNNVAHSTSKNIDIVCGYNSTNSLEAAGYRHDSHRTGGNAKDTKLTMEQRPSNISSKGVNLSIFLALFPLLFSLAGTNYLFFDVSILQP